MKPNGRIQQFPLLRVALMLVAGIVAGDALYGAVGQSVWMLSAVALLLLSFTLWHRPITQSCVIMAVIVLAGAWRVTARLGDVCMTLPDKPVCYEAVVASRPVAHGKVVRCDLLVSNGALVRRKIRASILCNERDGRARRLSVGDGMRIVSELREPENYHKDSNFDYRRWMSVHGFVATTFLLPSSWHSLPVSLDSLSRTDRISLRAMRLRESLLSRIHSLRGMSAEERAVVAAMTLGDKSGLTGELKETYSVTGATHVLALSGLHLGIIYFILTLLFSRRRVHKHARHLYKMFSLGVGIRNAPYIFENLVGICLRHACGVGIAFEQSRCYLVHTLVSTLRTEYNSHKQLEHAAELEFGSDLRCSGTEIIEYVSVSFFFSHIFNH